MKKAIYAKKIGMTQVFDEKGDMIPVTVLEAGPCTVVRKKSKAIDGYQAVCVSFGEVKAKKSGAALQLISNSLFYIAIVMILLTVLTSGSDAGVPKTIFGFSYYTVVSGSMQDEIPKGSFILVRNLDPNALNIGDTITYMRDRNTSVTHKIIEIHENYANSGARGFVTKGVNNANPDSDVVIESSVVGKVILAIPGLGAMMLYLAANVYIVFIIFGLFVIMSFCIRGLFPKLSKKKLQHP